VDATRSGREYWWSTPPTDTRRFWPPTKIAGRYPSPYLATLDETRERGAGVEPSGELVDLVLQSQVPAVAELERSLNHFTNESGHP
jgi:hypothetical protein